ncbi:MAG: hypothetical protein GX025_10665 [Clostridiales bacterium]|nr:hypothetical protein [Clostridiales bacterium]
MNSYTGIGSRQTPAEVLNSFTRLAKWLDKRSFILRSGGADGADSAFEAGTTNKEIYLPWKNFNGNPSPLHQISPDAELIAQKFHPAWDKCTQGVKKLHARNVYQILGSDLQTPSQFIICWTPNGTGSGGTGQALRIAHHYNIPIFDFGAYNSLHTAQQACNQFLKEKIV